MNYFLDEIFSPYVELSNFSSNAGTQPATSDHEVSSKNQSPSETFRDSLASSLLKHRGTETQRDHESFELYPLPQNLIVLFDNFSC
jgi:hypothetical protein